MLRTFHWYSARLPAACAAAAYVDPATARGRDVAEPPQPRHLQPAEPHRMAALHPAEHGALLVIAMLAVGSQWRRMVSVVQNVPSNHPGEDML